MKKLTLLILITTTIAVAGFSNSDTSVYSYKMKTIKELTQWFKSNRYTTELVGEYKYLPKGAKSGAWYKLNNEEYNCYIFDDKDSFDNFEKVYLKFTYGFMTQVLKFKKDNAEKLKKSTKFKQIYNVKCATNPGSVPL